MKLLFACAMAVVQLAAQHSGRISSPEAANSRERLEQWQAALNRAPDNLAAQAGLATAYLKMLRETADPTYFARASQLVERMLERNGGDLTALRLQNEIDLQQHNFLLVAERAASMTRYAPSDAGAWGNLGDASMELGDYDQAGRAYTHMFALRPGLESYNRLAFYRFVTGDATAAIELMRLAVEAGKDSGEETAWCQAELGDLYLKTGRIEDAAESYRGALARFPRLHRAYAGLGKVERARGNVPAAIASYERAEAMVPLVEYVATLEDLYRLQGDSAKAVQQRQKLDAIALLGKVNNEKTNRNLALALADRDRNLPLALSLMEAEIPVRGDVYTWDAYSWVLFKAGRRDEARAALAKALSRHTPEPLFQQHAAMIDAAAWAN